MLNESGSAATFITISQIYDQYKRFNYRPAGELLGNGGTEGEIIKLPGIQSMAGFDSPQVAVLKNIYLAGRYALVMTPSGQLISESEAVDNPEEAIKGVEIVEISDGNTVYKKGSYLPLCGYSSGGFRHWITEFVPAIIHARLAGFTGYYLVSPLAPRFILETLEMLGVPRGQIMAYDGKPWLVETVYLPQKLRAADQLFHYPGVIKLLRETMLSAAGVKARGAGKKIYISRVDAPRGRRVVNEADLINLLEKYDFEIFCMSAFSLKEQIAIISGADTMITPHGAGMVHSLFMPERSLILEMFSPEHVATGMLPVIDCLGHCYHMVLPECPGKSYGHGNDIEANLAVIETILRSDRR